LNRREALAQTRKILTENKIEDASLEGEILLRYILGINRAQLYTELDGDVSPNDIKRFFKLVERRVKGEPSVYIIGKKEFYGLDFEINKHVLIPRPETELLVEQAINLCRKYHYYRVADIGTGCGAIAVSLAVNLPGLKIFATDISSQVLKIAKRNCVKHGVNDRIRFLRGDMLQPLFQSVDLIIANLPYVKEQHIKRIGPEPKTALNGGEKGLDKIGRLCQEVGEYLNPWGSLLLEIGQGQAEEVKSILHKSISIGTIEIKKDLAGIDRVVWMHLT
jgi:release factor glutamine methyltransferase